MLSIKKFTFNQVQENTFVVYDETGECVIIDAGCYYENERQELDAFISKQQLKPVRLINTHCHFDHIMGITHCRTKYHIDFEAHENEVPLVEQAAEHGDLFGIPMEPVDAPDAYFQEGDQINFGKSYLQVIEAPGHSPGGVVFYNPEQQILIAGDVLFYGSIGRTDLPGGSFDRLVDNIKTKLLTLPEETKVYCGHGPETTIGFEKKNNPFLT
ncbi:MAG TPA: MBL fold metallo-hydrolase [Prolixibacteraceae bacterium]|jgi:glyoxylase-like metal-dependent hydrolase (beta-lactamase superfamily II)